MTKRNNQVVRIYQVLSILDGSRQGLTAKEIHSKLADDGIAVEQRTVYRDLEALQAAGFPLEVKGIDDNGGERWHVNKTTMVTQSLAFDSKELLALFLARNMLTPLRDTPFYADLRTAFAKIESKVPSAGRNHLSELADELKFEAGTKWSLDLNPDVMDTVRSACAERQILKIQYDSQSSGSNSERRLGPHFLYFARGSLYLVAEDLADNKIKTWSLPRILDAEMLDEDYSAEAIDPEKHFESSFGIYRADKAEKIRIEIHHPMSAFVRERGWHHTQRIVNRKNNIIEVQFEVGVTPELVNWIMGFGAAAIVLEPSHLAGLVEDAARALLANYGRKVG